jgi:preprotein translocase subunit SecY
MFTASLIMRLGKSTTFSFERVLRFSETSVDHLYNGHTRMGVITMMSAQGFGQSLWICAKSKLEVLNNIYDIC